MTGQILHIPLLGNIVTLIISINLNVTIFLIISVEYTKIISNEDQISCETTRNTYALVDFSNLHQNIHF